MIHIDRPLFADYPMPIADHRQNIEAMPFSQGMHSCGQIYNEIPFVVCINSDYDQERRNVWPNSHLQSRVSDQHSAENLYPLYKPALDNDLSLTDQALLSLLLPDHNQPCPTPQSMQESAHPKDLHQDLHEDPYVKDLFTSHSKKRHMVNTFLMHSSK
jgi:hypothetical protein